MVCALHGTDGLGALDNPSLKKNRTWLNDNSQSRGPEPRRRLADLETLTSRIIGQNYMSEFGGNALAISPADMKDLVRLYSLRKKFAHYDPSSWSIQAVGLPRITAVACRIVRRLSQHPALAIRLQDLTVRLDACLTALESALPNPDTAT